MHVKNKRKLKLSFFFFCIAGGKKVLGGVDYESSFREGEENREKQAKGERTLKSWQRKRNATQQIYVVFNGNLQDP